jgi:Uncharacterized conserved protein
MTNQQTFVRVDGKEIEVRPTMMDTAIAVDRKGRAARAVKFFDVHKGDEIVMATRVCAWCLCSARRRARIFFNSSTRSSMLMNRNRPLFANWLRNCDALARQRQNRSCGRPGDRADRCRSAFGAPYRGRLCRSTFRRKSICRLRRGTSVVRHFFGHQPRPGVRARRSRERYARGQCDSPSRQRCRSC